MIYDDYIEYCKKYEALYDKLVVLMEVGSFFEFYSVENERLREGANMSEICSLLNIQSTRKNKSIPECSRTNPMMAGFPSHSLHKFTEILVSNSYTIVLVEQVTSPPNPKREVTQIISPSTDIERVSSSSSNYLLCFYISTGFRKEKYDCLSVSYVDFTTGETFVFHNEMNGDIQKESLSIISLIQPKEIVVIYENDNTIKLDLPVFFHDHRNVNLKPFQSISFQTSILKKVYPETGLLSPIEFIDLEKNVNILTSFVYMINFAYEHNENIIKKLRKPTIIENDSYLKLTNLSAEHLNIIPKKGNESSLLQLLNTCDTPIGKRYFKDCLLFPLTNPDQIIKRYDRTEKMIDKQNFKLIRPCLHSIKDLERLFRRLSLKTLQPSEMVTILTSLESVQRIHTMIQSMDIDIQLDSFQSFIDLSIRWDLEKMNSCTNQQFHPFYKKGYFPEIDDLSNQINDLHSYFQNIINESNQIVNDSFFKLETTAERQDYQIIITKKRYETYLEKLGKRKNLFTSQPLSSSNKTILKVTFQQMNQKQTELHEKTSELKSLLKQKYMEDLDLFQPFSEIMNQIVSFIAQIDFHVTCAKNALSYHYSKPCLSGNQSFLSAKKIRHPLIEVYQKDIPYIPNDVDLNDKQRGMLLYGINSAGKSSYMKSVGVNLIMAQAGMYVASDSFTYFPYESIFTRIPNGDNLFKGQSTFVAEMSELRSILKYSTNRSLVIGDEVASGTESVSAISIVSAGISMLSQRSSSFIFATHLHEVAKLETILNLSNVTIYHISVHYDEQTGLLIYDRVLREGSGETLYGLEVCKSLDMPPEFIYLANTIRQEHLQLSKTVVNTKTSRYSSEVFVDLCSICKNKAEEIHHIKEQVKADKNGFIGSIHKNDKHNLVSVCQTCHDRIHNGNITLNGYIQTSKGKDLIITKNTDSELKQQIIELRKEKSIALISKELNMSLYKIKKLLL